MNCDFCKKAKATVKIVATDITTETVLNTRIYCAECGHMLVLDCNTGDRFKDRKPFDPNKQKQQVAEAEAAILRGREAKK